MSETLSIDLNADAGESFGRWRVANEEALFPQLSSVNLACGFHASDPLTMLEAVDLAKRNGVAVGAHPGFMDKAGFGRRDIQASYQELYSDTLYQLGALKAFLVQAGLAMHHVKAHGALYIKMTREEPCAQAVCAAIKDFDSMLPVVILAGSGGQLMAEAAREAGLRAVAEAFPDRAYTAQGELASRRLAGAVFDDPEQIAERAVLMATGQPFASLEGEMITLTAQTLCLHGDNANSALTAVAVRQALEGAGLTVSAF